MSPNKLGVFANLALVASAVLIPPSMTAEDLGDNKLMEGFVIDPFSRAVTLDCPGCPFASREGDSYKWTPDAGNSFRLDLKVADKTNFNIDDVQVFPPTLSVNTIHVTQIDPSSEEDLRLRVTGFQFRYNGAETVSETGTELLPVTIKIASIEEIPVDLPELTINLLKDGEGRLMIASSNTARPVKEGSPIDEVKECNEWPLLCKWKSMLADKMERMKKMGKGCHDGPHGFWHGKPPHGLHPGMPQDFPDHGSHHMDHMDHKDHMEHMKHMGHMSHEEHMEFMKHMSHEEHMEFMKHMDHKGHMDHMHHMGHHHYHHHRHGRVQAFLRRAFFTIFIPIVIGIFAGTVTYLIGMALGCLIAMTIAKIRGQSYQRIALEDDVAEAGERSEKEDFAELPAYDAPPVYDEVAEKEVSDSK